MTKHGERGCGGRREGGREVRSDEVERMHVKD